MRKRSFCFVLLAWAGATSLMAQSAPTSAHLHLERAPALTGPWTVLRADQLPPSGDGGLLDPLLPGAAFYRLRIDLQDPQGGPLGLPLDAVDPVLLQIAKEHLESLRPEIPEWQEARLAPVVTPVYDPAVHDGRKPAWLEFKVISTAGARISAAAVTKGFAQSPPLLPEADLGFLLVATGEHDEPLPQYATRGLTPCEQLRRRAGTANIRIVRYSASFWVAENGKGDAVATLGSTPIRYGPALLELAGLDFGGEIEDGKPIQMDKVPPIATGAFQSYQDFRNDYLKGAVPMRLRKYQGAFGKLEWGLHNDQLPPQLDVPLKEAVVVLGKYHFRNAEVEDDELARVDLNPKGGLNILGRMRGTTLLTTVRADGTLEYYVLAVDIEAMDFQSNAHWTSWTTYYGGSCADIPLYVQEWGLWGACTHGWSGCGPTAWAMFYGYWDHRGVHDLIPGEDTPWSNNDAVRDLIQTVFDYTDTWCTHNDAQAATNPWNMHEGYRWASHQGEHIHASYRWSLPYASSRPRKKAIAAIKDHHRPAIVGIGYYAHYPLAYGYKYRKRKWGRITLKTERRWKVNMGWGSRDCNWVSAKSCWFGMDAYCY